MTAKNAQVHSQLKGRCAGLRCRRAHSEGGLKAVRKNAVSRITATTCAPLAVSICCTQTIDKLPLISSLV